MSSLMTPSAAQVATPTRPRSAGRAPVARLVPELALGVTAGLDFAGAGGSSHGAAAAHSSDEHNNPLNMNWGTHHEA